MAGTALLACFGMTALGSLAVLNVSADTSTTANTSAELSADDLILSMTDALRELNYEGTFVYLSRGNMTSLRIVHANKSGNEMERMMSLDGEAREVVRDNSMVTCIWPDTRSVVVTSSKPREQLPHIDSVLADGDFYELSLGQLDRVAGRVTRIVEVEPGDALRYGYRFWIDVETHMLLRTALLDEYGHPIEQVLFTAIEYPDSIDDKQFDIANITDIHDWALPRLTRAVSALESTPLIDPTDAVSDRIDYTGLPAGYREVSETWRTMPGSSGPVSHAMVSDGMASVSVYVEHANESQSQAEYGGHAQGHSSMGGLSAYGRAVDGSFITVVGEVPAETVRLIAHATVIED